MNVPEAFSRRRRDESRDVEPFEAMMTVRNRTFADRRPYPSRDRFQPEAMLVGGEGLNRYAGMTLRFLRDGLGLKSSCSWGVAASGLCGRGRWIDQSSAFSASQPRVGDSFSTPS